MRNSHISARNKHIDVRHHFIRNLLSEGVADFQYVPRKQNIADGLTKALPSLEHAEVFLKMMKVWDKGEGSFSAKRQPSSQVQAGDEDLEPQEKKLKTSSEQEDAEELLALVLELCP